MYIYGCKIFLWFLFYSVVGWIYETILVSCTQKHFVNRGFLNGTYCPIYGCGAMLDILLLGNVESYASLFLSSMVLTCTLEYFTSWILEKMFHAKWWDYSTHKFNLNGRICLEGALVFAFMSLMLIKFIHPFIISVTQKVGDTLIGVITPVLLAWFIYDITITVVHLIHLNTVMKRIDEAMEKAKAEIAKRAILLEQRVEELEEQAEERRDSLKHYLEAKREFIISELGAAKLSHQEKHSFKAFPQFKSLDYEEISDKIRDILRKR